ncbi:MAG: HAD-IB family hydrolase [Rhodocyclales bacterium CG17_big_fil_post_rev_8_21_14_2_50_68_7]|nr:MAG: HAD-IB family hydrolase [Rhodocyclales bacterium CG17_big_fil_post_rev_8_21_14_2_50_68_7]PJA58008.1 MAG: HAD-IB family hydrolase [Rhodocyclales bacterium CG_4_9_14_3_um_filter_68_10]
MDLALFDLDNTLLAGDSDFEWAQFLIERGVLDRELYEARNAEFLDQYRRGVLDIHAFLDFQLKPLSRHSRRQLDDWHRAFMRSRILPIINEAGRALVRRHLEEGALAAIVTATNSFVTAPICAHFGVSHLIATEPESIAGRFTGRVAGLPSFREGKVTRVEQWLAGRGRKWSDFDRSFFYSDSLNDLALLARVSRPVAVDPDETLAAHAKARGWPILSLREPHVSLGTLELPHHE